MRLFDTHAHLDDEQFAEILDDVLLRCKEAGVDRILAVGTTASSSGETVALAQRYESVYAAVGIQPNCCAQARAEDWRRIVELAHSERVIAIGETGLDRYWDYTPFDLQEDYFDRHLRLAQQMELPVVIHMRDCQQDILRMLGEAVGRGKLKGIMHSFTGDTRMAASCLDLGMYISFAGMVTYKKATELREVAAQITDERLLIETDAPYLSPHPRRGQRPNEPSLIRHTAECLAEVRGVSLADLADLTFRNASQLFGLT